MHGEARSEEIARSALRTLPGLILAFRSEHGLTSEQLAILLDVEPEALRQHETLGTAPPWMAYALAGLAYEQFGVAPGDEAARSVPSVPPARVVLPLHSPMHTPPAGGECAA